MDIQTMPQSQNSLQRLNDAVEELLRVVQNQKNQFNQQLMQQKNYCAELESKLAVAATEKTQLTEQLNTARNDTHSQDKLKQMADEIEVKNSKIAGLQTEVQNLNNALLNKKAQLDEAENKNKELSEKLAEMQQAISQTSDNIDEVVAKLEKVIQENGASDNNN